MDTIEPVIRQHRLVMDATVAKADIVRSGLFQMTHMTTARGALKHDDRIDVLAMAMSYWAEYLNADAKKAKADLAKQWEREWEARGTSSASPG